MHRKGGDVGHAAASMNVSFAVPLERRLFGLIHEALAQCVELEPQASRRTEAARPARSDHAKSTQPDNDSAQSAAAAARTIRSSHSAASLPCPRRLLRVLRSFSAASAITVPGREDRLGAGLHQRVVILRRHHAADHNHDVVAALLGEFRLQFRHQRQVGRGERGHAENMHVVLDRLAGGFRRRCEQRSNVDVEAEISEGRGNHLLAAVVAVLADLGDQAGAGGGLPRPRRPRRRCEHVRRRRSCRPPACKLR